MPVCNAVKSKLSSIVSPCAGITRWRTADQLQLRSNLCHAGQVRRWGVTELIDAYFRPGNRVPLQVENMAVDDTGAAILFPDSKHGAFQNLPRCDREP